VDSENNSLDPTKDIIEIFIVNNTDKSDILEDKEQTDGGLNDGLLYSNQNIPCELPMTVQGWLLNGSDFSNMSIRGDFNGTEVLKNA
jgi:hypothetical protein